MRHRVNITEQVIASIAGMAAASVEGVSELRGSVADNLKAILGEEGRSGRGVTTRVEGEDVYLALHVAVEYGHPIHEVAQKLQRVVKAEVEGMTGLRVRSVDVYVSDLTLPKRAWDSEAPQDPAAARLQPETEAEETAESDRPRPKERGRAPVPDEAL